MLVVLPSLQVSDSPHKHGLENTGGLRPGFLPKAGKLLKCSGPRLLRVVGMDSSGLFPGATS